MIFRPAPELREIAEELKSVTALMWRFHHIDPARIGFFYETTCEKTDKVAELTPVDPLWWSVLDEFGVYWDYLIAVYGYHAEGKSRNWLKILVYHELRHIGIDGKLVKHQVEDFKDILREFGIDWLDNDPDLPDIAKLPANAGWEACSPLN